jgi:hypothetical protein
VFDMYIVVKISVGSLKATSYSWRSQLHKNFKTCRTITFCHLKKKQFLEESQQLGLKRFLNKKVSSGTANTTLIKLKPTGLFDGPGVAPRAAELLKNLFLPLAACRLVYIILCLVYSSHCFQHTPYLDVGDDGVCTTHQWQLLHLLLVRLE